LIRGLFVTQIQGNGIRIFPALNIKKDELEKGLLIIEEAMKNI
jgi:acetylornithine/N-succinyldiaminopimelate aminotransferase